APLSEGLGFSGQRATLGESDERIEVGEGRRGLRRAKRFWGQRKAGTGRGARPKFHRPGGSEKRLAPGGGREGRIRRKAPNHHISLGLRSRAQSLVRPLRTRLRVLQASIATTSATETGPCVRHSSCAGPSSIASAARTCSAGGPDAAALRLVRTS